MLKKIGKIFLKILLGIFLLILLLTVLIQFPAIQSRIVDLAAKQLSKVLKTEVTVGSVDIEFVKTVSIQDILIKDEARDTLASLEELDIAISLFSLFRKKIVVNDIAIDGLHANINNQNDAEQFNYQFIIDAFTSDVPKDTSAGSWEFGINNLSLTNSNFIYGDYKPGGLIVEADLSQFRINLNELNVADQSLDVSKIELEDSKVNLIRIPHVELPTDKNLPEASIVFPNFGWNIAVNKLALNNNDLLYKIQGTRQATQFSPNYIKLNQEEMLLQDVVFGENKIEGKINLEQLKVEGLEDIQEVALQFKLAPEELAIPELKVKTRQSIIAINGTLKAENFAALINPQKMNSANFNFINWKIAATEVTKLLKDVGLKTAINPPPGQYLTANGQLNYNPKGISKTDVKLTLGELTNLSLAGQFQNLFTDPLLDVHLKNLTTEYDAISKWIPDSLLTIDFSNLGKINLSSKIKGTLDDLVMNETSFITGSDTKLVGDFRAKNITDIKRAEFNLDFQQLQTVVVDIKPILGDSLPPILDSLEFIRFVGTFRGTTHEFNVSGDLNAVPGEVSTDLSIYFNEDYSNAEYNGLVKMDSFNLGVLVSDSLPLGAITFDAELQGLGLDPKNLDLNVRGKIDAVEYNDYNYHNLSIDGILKGLKFRGKLMADDPNVKLDFDGLVDGNAEVPILQAALNVDTINLHTLNFYPTPLSLSAIIKGDFTGNKFDNLIGSINIPKLNLADSLNTFSDTTINLLIVEKENNTKALKLTSKVLDGQIIGKYKVVNLGADLMQYVEEYFPINKNKDREAMEINEIDQSFSFSFIPKRLNEIATIFLGAPLAVDPASNFSGTFDRASGNLDAALNVLKVDFDGITLDSFNLIVNGEKESLAAKVNLDGLDYRSSFFADHFNFNVNLKEEKAVFDFELTNNQDSTLFAWGGLISKPTKDYKLVFNKDLILDDQQWQVNSDNNIIFKSKAPTINNLRLVRGSESIVISSEGEVPPSDWATIDLKVEQFDLLTVSNLINNPITSFDGSFDGSIKIFEPINNLHFNADLAIEALELNEQRIGKVNVKAVQKIGSDKIDIAVDVSENNQAKFIGDYTINNQNINLDLDFDKLSLVLIDPFMNDVIEKSKGSIRGKLKVTGKITEPSVYGKLTTQELSTVVAIAGVRYYNDSGIINISNNRINFENFNIKDGNSREAKLDGLIKHNQFNDFVLDLKFNSEGLKILDTRKGNNDLYYGKIITKANVAIKGPIDLLDIDIRATTLDSTNITVQPLIEDYVVKQDDYIIFGDPNSAITDSVHVLEYQAASSGLNVNMKLEVTKDAKLDIVVDPISGDRLKAFGEGNLLIDMDPSGNVSITGNYELIDGDYRFSYENLVKKNFKIQKGSSLVFVGDPLDTKFDITAIYETETSTAALVQNEVTDQSELNRAHRRSLVEVIMKMEGDLNGPIFSFDLNIPKTSNALGDAVTSKIQALRNDPSELNKQVFGLLLFNNFIAAESSTNLATSGENILLGSVSELITKQLNSLANKYLGGINLEVGFDSYRTNSDNPESVSELNLGFSKQFFNDRLTVKAGGDFNLSTSQESPLTSGNSTTIAGNFVLEYRLDKNGNYLIRVFHDKDYQSLLEANSNRTGVGIRFNKSY